MGTNKADQYDAAVRITENEVLVDVKDAALISDFSSAQPGVSHQNMYMRIRKNCYPKITDRVC